MAADLSKGKSYKTSATYLPRPVLLRTGMMKSSWTYRVERENDLVVIMVGTKIPYARHHELGEGVPQRRQVVITALDRKKIADIVGDVLNKGV
jgi:phage gpG-like protein